MKILANLTRAVMHSKIILFVLIAFSCNALQAQKSTIVLTPRIDTAVNLIKSKVVNTKCLVVAIGGADLSGRSQLVDDIYQELMAQGLNVGVIRLSLYRVSYDVCLKDKNPGRYFYENEVNYPLLFKDVLQPLKNKRSVSKKVKITGAKPVDFTFKNLDVVLVEGNMVLRSVLRSYFDVTLWSECSTTSLKERMNMVLTGKPDSAALQLANNGILLVAHNQLQMIDNPVKNADISFVADDRLRTKSQVFIFEDFKGKKIDSRLQWINPPKVWKLQKGMLCIEPEQFTDFWQRTLFDYKYDNAHMLGFDSENDFVMTTKVSYEPKNQYDQAGLVVRVSEDCWLKAAVEYHANEPAILSTVVTNGGFSDQASQPFDNQVTTMEWRITRSGRVFTIEYLNANSEWIKVRVAQLNSATETVKCGLYCCCPIDNGAKVNFDYLKIEESVK
jgi:regulation of enolase protein 1 (concanavalin A-like superfamily)/uridine kinase